MNDEAQREAMRDDPRMRDPAEIAAEREYNREGRSPDPDDAQAIPETRAVRELWLVEGQFSTVQSVCNSEAHANALCLVKNIECASIGPYRVTHFVEQPA